MISSSTVHPALEPELDELLLRVLPGRGSWKLSESVLLAEARALGRSVAEHVVRMGLVRRAEVVRTILEIKGTFGIPVEDEFVELRLPRTFPLETAIQARILPFATFRGFVFAVEDAASPIDAAHERRAAGHEIVLLGSEQRVPERTRELYDLLRGRDPGKLSYAQFLKSKGIGEPATTKTRVLPGQIPAGPDPVQADLQAQLDGTYRDQAVVSEARIRELLDPAVVARARELGLVHPVALPFRIEEHILWIAACGLPNLPQLDLAAARMDCTRPHILLTPASALHAILAPEGPARAPASVNENDARPPAAAASDSTAEIPAITSRLLEEAVRRGCSDIHIERFETRVDVRFRRDGNLVLVPHSGITLENIQHIVAKLKVDARLDITETRRPQDGVIRRHFEDESVDYRVATQPTIWGENVILRILEQVSPPRLDDLGFEPVLLTRIRRILQNPQGLVLVTGPTGSGKTTTLYSALEEMKNPEIKIVTCEDPVEYAIDGIQQCQVNENIGNTFGHFLRSFMREDPDVIFIGEIRDNDTAQAAVGAALTGHLVLTTLHANDVFGVIRRLEDLGVQPSLVAQTVQCIVGQRLARRLCPHCLVPDAPPPTLLREFFPLGLPDGARLLRGAGCDQCEGSGYKGRIALMEVWLPDDDARHLIDRAADPRTLRASATVGRFESLIESAVRQALDGKTSLEELRTVVPYDHIERYAAQLMARPGASQAPALAAES